ncbi:MFS transporter [Actinomadura sp. ATCC 31491]|uniref:MFS transporter n=1 Tax=Actinomadura luzonensis TaxID=2805427 RepID=A0ABT0FVP9_9ACTN|nr:MFS transporter [Actinomadura luzonensis]MCK2215983.1 MFS transporter [Actinomadura luzonensis]
MTLAALAHVLGGGSGPAAATAGLGLAAAAGLGLALSGRERSAPAVNVALVVAQLGLHELFAGDDASGTTAYVPVHGHGQGLAVNAGMLAAHLTATLITGLWLARGEAALWALLRRAGRRLTLLRPVAAPAVPPRPRPSGRTRAVPLQPVLRHCLARRGPPLPA